MKRRDFNKNWLFSKIGDEKEELSIDLPHDAMILEKRKPDCQNGENTGYFPGGNYIYKKKFLVPDEWEGKSVSIEFERSLS